MFLFGPKALQTQEGLRNRLWFYFLQGHPYFQRTDARGRFSPGRVYRLRAKQFTAVKLLVKPKSPFFLYFSRICDFEGGVTTAPKMNHSFSGPSILRPMNHGSTLLPYFF